MPTRRKSYRGLSAITSERIYQVEKGWTQSHDRKVHTGRSLAVAARRLLDAHLDSAPVMREEWIEELEDEHGEDYEYALRVAGALIAAELSRIGAK